MLYDHLHHYHSLGKTDSANCATSALQIEKRSMTRWHKDLYGVKGSITAGKVRPSLLDQEDIGRKSVSWLRENWYIC